MSFSSSVSLKGQNQEGRPRKVLRAVCGAQQSSVEGAGGRAARALVGGPLAVAQDPGDGGALRGAPHGAARLRRLRGARAAALSGPGRDGRLQLRPLRAPRRGVREGERL